MRYSKAANQLLGGEHFSALIAEDGQLLGFAKMQTAHPKHLPSQADAKTAGDEWLKKFAPDLLEERKILWIAPHSETINIDSCPQTIEGMKVKSQNQKNGLYFWSIVDGDGEVFVSERDIEWLDFAGKRGTEQWLHDDWLAKQGAT